MIRKFFLILAVCLTVNVAKAFPPVVLKGAEGIDNELLENAHAVIRKFSQTVNVDKSGKQFSVTQHCVVTILNPKGKEAGDISETFDSFDAVSGLDGVVYDKTGKVVVKIKKKDISIHGSSLGYGYYDDAKEWSYKVTGIDYPYTVEYNLTYKTNQTFFLPWFEPQWEDYCAVESADFTVITEPEFKLRYRQFGYGEEWPKKTVGDNRTVVYKWECSNLKAIRKESLMPKDFYPDGTVVISAEEVNLQEHPGKISTWQDLSAFVYHLNDKKDELPEAIATKAKEIASGKNTTEEKVAALYKYMQDETRYVAIEYGINGWQTLDAAYTARNKFGDCKALTYYMKGLLKVAGIQSYAALIYAGDAHKNVVLPDFPQQVFNHVILMVPQNPDTIWLECTSKDLPSGYLSDFTQNRKALVLTHSNGGLVHTPIYDTAHNKVVRFVKGTLDNDGVCKLSFKNRYWGEDAIDVYRSTNKKSRSEIDQYATSKFGMSSYKVNAIKYSRNNNADNVEMEEEGELMVNNSLKSTQEYTIVNYNLLPIKVPTMLQVGKREAPFHIVHTVNIIDSFEIDWTFSDISSLPQAVKWETPFGLYSREMVLSGNKLLVYRQFTQKQGVYQAADFSAYEEFLSRVRKDSNKGIVVPKAQ